MKKFLSTILAVVMVLSSMAMVVSADETAGTITVYNANNELVEGTYTTIDTAAAAAGVNGKIVLSAGIFEFNGRQTIQVEGVDLIGAGSDQTFIVPSTSYANASATNKKALVTVAADNVKIEGVNIDGSIYGANLNKSTDFVVLRINDGTGVELDDVYVAGSNRTLISVGTADSVKADVEVEATNLVCAAPVKTLPNNAFISTFSVYSDVNVKNAKFTLVSGQVDGFISLDDECSGEIVNNTTDHYTLLKDSDDETSSITSTFEHYMASYIKSENETVLFAPSYSSVFSYSTNLTTVGNMVTEADSHENSTYVEAFVRLLTAAKNKADSATAATLETYISTLSN